MARALAETSGKEDNERGLVLRYHTALCAAMRDSIESLKPYTTTLFPIPYSLAQSAIKPVVSGFP
ncbi:hypothetical protein [Roseofilum sp. Guam]|uniref:hypothetical protein n=1 Tax=Roseofilum sp. Guam TaxID=2821502 RepID=UPI001B2DBA6A|nr:hypothetical protein [Roseofilum sp. Guam]MBP0030163.1 hypothetical protein [Roseofilum sp. Guam]